MIEKKFSKSYNFRTWIAIIDVKTCAFCRNSNGKIFPVGQLIEQLPPAHLYCRCRIEYMRALYPGEATENKYQGADYYLYKYSRLPDYYIDSVSALLLGWSPKKGNLDKVAPNKMLYGGIYKNYNNKLPTAKGRIWYEADINYIQGFRGSHRILYSNDDLIFVTYDHYQTFVEIIL